MDLVFGWFLIDILKCVSFCDRRAKEFIVSMYFVNIFVLFLIEKCVAQSLFAIFILHSRESELYCHTLDGKSALAWELPFSRFMGHLSST